MKNVVLFTLIFLFQICVAQNSTDIEKKALKGDPDAQFKLAEFYDKNENNISGKNKAFDWAMRSALQGHKKAQLMVGNVYAYKPDVIEKNIDEAIFWFKESANQNYCEAFNSLGWLYSGEFKDIKSLQIALDWFNKGIESNCLSTMGALGNTYLFDKRLPNRLNNGLKWIEKAANLGDVDAQYSLGSLYETPEYGSEGLDIKIDLKKAVFWYEKAAKNKDTLSMYFLASILGKEENLVVYDLDKANYWYEQSAILGNTLSQYAFGLNLFNGNGLVRNIDEGLSLLKQAGYKKDYSAQEALGIIYCSGLNVKQDVQVGWYWLDKLIDNEDIYAKMNVVDIAERYLKSDTVFALKLYTKSAMKGNETSQNNLGVIYLNGKIVPQDIEKAKYWLKMAVKNGSEIAIDNLKIAESLESKK